MKKANAPKFSKASLDFLVKASRQKKPEWLGKNQEEYDDVLRLPFIGLAEKIKSELHPLARDYHFPTKGLGRIKRPEFKVRGGQPLYKDWLSMIATRPSASRFESHPHLFFGIFPNESDFGSVFSAGGLYMPTSLQTQRIRRAIAEDPSPFHELFSDSRFKARFKGGFVAHNMSSRVPRGFAVDHPDLEWIKLKSFIVVRKISLKEFSSAKLGDGVVEDFKQALRLNQLLDLAIQGNWPPE